MLGFLLHSFISFRRRFVEFSVLRAIGLSVGQMIGLLGIEQLVLVGAGITAGTGLGVWVSDRFIPFLQVGTARHFDIPPFVVLIAWDDVIQDLCHLWRDAHHRDCRHDLAPDPHEGIRSSKAGRSGLVQCSLD